MAVPKRRTSMWRKKIRRNSHYKRITTQVVKTADKKAYKRPHVDEYIEL